MRGIVKWFSDRKGFGFVEVNGEDIFVHYTAILADGHRSLIKGEIIEFDLVKTEKGKKAKNIVSVTEEN